MIEAEWLFLIVPLAMALGVLLTVLALLWTRRDEL